MNPEALAHLSKVDRTMARLIRKVGPCPLKPNLRRSPFEALLRAIAHQQLTGRVAEVILERFLGLFPGGGFPAPESVLALSDDQLRAVGFSRAKSQAIRDLAGKAIAGIVPTSRAIRILEDEAIIEQLTQVRGIGRWTVEMLLIFKLARPDILPADDFGVRKGFSLAYGLEDLPTRSELLEFGQRWAPHRTTAAWYLWRAADAQPRKLRKPVTTPPKSRPRPRSIRKPKPSRTTLSPSQTSSRAKTTQRGKTRGK